MSTLSINGWRVMWLLITFDLPTKTKTEIKCYTQFRKLLLEENFMQMQFSVYIKHFPTVEIARNTAKRIGNLTPPRGKTSFFLITDKQFGMCLNFYGNMQVSDDKTIQKGEQYVLFSDEDY